MTQKSQTTELKNKHQLALSKQNYHFTLRKVLPCISVEKYYDHFTMSSSIITTFILLICSVVERTSPSPTGNIFIRNSIPPRVPSTSPRKLFSCTIPTPTSEPTRMYSPLSPVQKSFTSLSPSTRTY